MKTNSENMYSKWLERNNQLTNLSYGYIYIVNYGLAQRMPIWQEHITRQWGTCTYQTAHVLRPPPPPERHRCTFPTNITNQQLFAIENICFESPKLEHYRFSVGQGLQRLIGKKFKREILTIVLIQSGLLWSNMAWSRDVATVMNKFNMV